MNKNTICSNCKKSLDDHTKNELLSCQLEITKNIESEKTEKEIIDDFNEIKSGEFHRMGEN